MSQVGGAKNDVREACLVLFAAAAAGAGAGAAAGVLFESSPGVGAEAGTPSVPVPAAPATLGFDVPAQRTKNKL